MEQRTSQYLLDKVKSLQNAIEFFCNKGIEEKNVFLAQIDFWSWEMDELIFSVHSFKERVLAWEASSEDLETMIRKHGIVVRTGKKYYGRWNRRAKSLVKAPITHLNSLIDYWNKFIQSLENQYLKKNLEQFGANALSDFNKFKKETIQESEYPKIVEDEEEE